jgi:hypothetical protein
MPAMARRGRRLAGARAFGPQPRLSGCRHSPHDRFDRSAASRRAIALATDGSASGAIARRSLGASSERRAGSGRPPRRTDRADDRSLREAQVGLVRSRPHAGGCVPMEASGPRERPGGASTSHSRRSDPALVLVARVADLTLTIARGRIRACLVKQTSGLRRVAAERQDSPPRPGLAAPPRTRRPAQGLRSARPARVAMSAPDTVISPVCLISVETISSFRALQRFSSDSIRTVVRPG